MSQPQQKLVQYLNEAHATEAGLVRVLQSQIAMIPRGSYRSGLEKHLKETRGHADRVQKRLGDLGYGNNRLRAGVGAAAGVIGQVLAFAKTPFDLVRGSGGEEKVLKNAKDACATEALEIATYTALERLARSVGDATTADLAASIRSDEQEMLERILGEIPELADAVVRAEVGGNGSYDLSKTGAADAAKRGARQARKVPGVARAEGQVKGAVASEEDLAIARYDTLTADEILGKLGDLSQVDLAKVASYERKHQKRTTVLDKIASMRADEPWPGYDEQSVAEIASVLGEADDERAMEVRSYERSHKNRTGVLKAAERELVNA